MRSLRIFLGLSFGLLLAGAPAAAQVRAKTETWTAIIYDAFQGYAYTWRLSADGTYAEDGKDIAEGFAIQETQTGTWTRTGKRLVLTQDTNGFVFDGRVRGEIYSGSFFEHGSFLSKFCAWKGTEIPAGCDDDQVG
jgi:hypothetical protein